MAHCKIWLDNYHTGQYYPGSQIQGKVVLNFSSETTFRNVKVRMIGHEHTEWTTTESYTEPGSNESKTRDVTVQSDNYVVSTEVILHGGHSGTTKLPTGQHMYPFSLILPNNIPSTYNCPYGSITYKVIALVDRPMAFDYEDTFIFIVVSLVDLNYLQKPDLLQPTNYSDEKTICCFCCAEGPISMDVSIPKRTLVLGEVINIAVRISNMSNTNVEGLELKLKQLITCRQTASAEVKTVENLAADINEVGVGAHGEHTFTLPVQLPSSFSIPNFTQCKLFKVNYTYKIIAKLPNVHSNLVIESSIEVGNIDINQQAPIGGFGSPNPTPYPIGPSYPINQPPPANGAGWNGGPQYPPAGQFPPGAYPPAPTQPFPQSSGAYPPQGYPSGAYGAPPTIEYSGKAQEAAGFPSAPSAPQTEQLPPSYDSINPQK
ncbi:arrestin domain-containing protein 3-like [Diabrotica undecimpunctata]|uniref:arrestin domain-containing protein 3-like n=1 Tax=Diabrotica undecimpunctata TaxID=50387 RepID=UPI003B63A5A8